jgi:hypothetical protein
VFCNGLRLIELHILLTCWFKDVGSANHMAGSIVHLVERSPEIPTAVLEIWALPPIKYRVTLRPSDEDARQVWRMRTAAPLQLSLTYIATVSPKEHVQPRNAPTVPLRT